MIKNLITTLFFLATKQVFFSFILLALFLISTVQFSYAQSRDEALHSFFSAIDKNGDINGSVLIMDNGKVLFQKSYGYRDIHNKIPNTENTLFQLASVSKIFTSVAIFSWLKGRNSI